jgi:pimeloyl-ACP methyl ester carboxylesterase
MSSVVSADGTPIGFDWTGDGPPIILVGGAFQYRAMDPRTAELAVLLAQQFSVVNYDGRGRGDSGHGADNTAADSDPVAREVEDIGALIHALGGGPVGPFGNSSGAALGLDAVAAACR